MVRGRGSSAQYLSGGDPRSRRYGDADGERGFAKQSWPERLEPVETIPHHAAGTIQKHLFPEKFVGNG
jgi:acyl-CoA synthetase (AMP-forming)/AMP-acid ligase II